MLFRPHPVLRALTRCGAAAALALGAASVSAVAHPDEETGALMGDLVFHADLMVSLDTLCRVKAPARDWQAVLGALPADVRTPELRDISRRLSADAAKSMGNALKKIYNRKRQENITKELLDIVGGAEAVK